MAKPIPILFLRNKCSLNNKIPTKSGQYDDGNIVDDKNYRESKLGLRKA